MQANRFVNIKNGLRAALAVALATWLGHYYAIAFSYWITLTVVVAIQPNVGATLQRAKLRVFSTLFGVLLGALLITMIRNHPLLVAATILTLLFFTLWLMLINYFYAIFLGSAALIIILGLHSENTWLFVQGRFVDTLIGVAIGLLFSLLLWPSWARLRFQQNILQVLGLSKELATLVWNSLVTATDDQENLSRINELKLNLGQALEQNQQAFAETRYENIALANKYIAAQAMLNSLERIRDILYALHGMQCSGIDFSKEQPVANFICNYQQIVDSHFAYFIARLAEEPAGDVEPLVMACREIGREKRHHAALYLQRNIDRINYELMCFQQALENFMVSKGSLKR